MKALYWKRDRGEKFQTITRGNAGVKIYRRARGKGKARRWIYEVVDWTRGPGARRLRSFGDYPRAHAEAVRIADQLATGKATAAAMLGTEAASYGRALELLRPTGVSLEAAAADYARGFELVGDAIVEACKFYSTHRTDLLLRRTVAELAAELLSNKEARGMSPRYLGDLKQKVTRFADAFAVDVGNITTADVQRFLDKLKAAPQTVKNYRTVLHTMFEFAEARGFIFKGGNPVADTEQIDTNGGGAIEIYSPQEMVELLKGAPKAFLPFMVLGGFAGLRTAEIERLQWSNVDLAGGFITIGAETAKTRTRRLVPILPNLAAWLAGYARLKGKVWKGDETDSREARAATVAKSGVGWKHNALRHSFCSYRLADIQDAAKVALEAGNSPAMVFRHYRELVKPEAARTWFAIAPKAPANVITLKTEIAI